MTIPTDPESARERPKRNGVSEPSDAAYKKAGMLLALALERIAREKAEAAHRSAAE